MPNNKILNGKMLSDKIKKQLKSEIEILKTNGLIPCLAVIIVGDDPASKIYVKHKKADCEFLGINSEEYALPEETAEEELLALIDELNNKNTIHGILVQMPLPPHIDSDKIIKAISPRKDVDAFHPENVGKIMTGNYQFLPCTPAGIVDLIDEAEIDLKGKHCVVIGRSNIVGKPLAMMLLHRDATVTICHSKTANLKTICQDADILVVAVGKANLINNEHIKDGAVVIDVGINRLSDGSLCGDVDFESVINKVSYITPVPGGVGVMTRAILMKNTIIAACMQKQ